MSSPNHKTKVEYGASAIVLLIGIFFIFQAFTIDASREAVGPRTMPLALAISLVIGSLWLAFRAFAGNVGDITDDYGFVESDINRILTVIGCGVLFVFVFWGFGYFAAIFSTYIAMLYTFGVRHKLWMIGGAIILAFAFQVTFMGVMMLNDPRGAILDLRPLTNWITGA
jgi:hypothetical protein